MQNPDHPFALPHEILTDVSALKPKATLSWISVHVISSILLFLLIAVLQKSGNWFERYSLENRR